MYSLGYFKSLEGIYEENKEATQKIEILPDNTIIIEDSCYKINEDNMVGMGSFGQVFRIYHVDKIHCLAMKSINKDQGKYQDLCNARETYILFKLNHENIVKFIGYSEKETKLFLFFEYCEGGSLRYYLNPPRKIPEPEALFIIEQIVKGMVECLKKHKIVHRDLKPENILFDPNKKLIKICDFGLARILEEDGKSRKKLTNEIGTLPYIAPEVIGDKDYDSKCDVWSIGIIFYELLFGKLPWDPVKNTKQLVEFFKNWDGKLVFPEKGSGISESTKKILKRMLEKIPQDRAEFTEVSNLFHEGKKILFNEEEFEETKEIFFKQIEEKMSEIRYEDRDSNKISGVRIMENVIVQTYSSKMKTEKK